MNKFAATFSYGKTDDGQFEILVNRRAISGQERRIALCRHESDAQSILAYMTYAYNMGFREQDYLE